MTTSTAPRSSPPPGSSMRWQSPDATSKFQAGLQRRRRRRHRLRRTRQIDGRAASECHPLRFQGRRLPGPHRGHEPMEIGACGRHQGADPRRSHGRRGCFLRPIGQGRAHRRDGDSRWRRSPIIFAMANPDPEITPEDVARSATTPSWPRAAPTIPNQINNVLGFPYIFRGALDVQRQDHQRADEDRCRAGSRRARARRMFLTKWPRPIMDRGSGSGRTI